jgi:hypothetical protein
VGVNVTETLQKPPAGSADGQLFVSAKSLAFAPPMKMLLIVSVPRPWLVTVICFVALLLPITNVAKAIFAGETFTKV